VAGGADRGDSGELAAGRLRFANGHGRRVESGEGGFKGGDLGAGLGEALIDGRDELSDV
jgi:hypothetical protein